MFQWNNFTHKLERFFFLFLPFLSSDRDRHFFVWLRPGSAVFSLFEIWMEKIEKIRPLYICRHLDLIVFCLFVFFFFSVWNPNESKLETKDVPQCEIFVSWRWSASWHWLLFVLSEVLMVWICAQMPVYWPRSNSHLVGQGSHLACEFREATGLCFLLPTRFLPERKEQTRGSIFIFQEFVKKTESGSVRTQQYNLSFFLPNSLPPDPPCC